MDEGGGGGAHAQQQPCFTPGGAMVTCNKCQTKQPGGAAAKFCANCGTSALPAG